MPALIAQGVRPEHRWRRRITEGQTFLLGRASGALSVPWDDHISRRHAELSLSDGVLTVTQFSEARNPIFFLGQPSNRFGLRLGQHFVIGGTTFTLVEEPQTIVAASPPMTEFAFAADQVRTREFRDAAKRIEVLSRLPEVIPDDMADEELCSRLVSFLLSGVTHAALAAVVVWMPDRAIPELEVLYWDRRDGDGREASFSERLVRQAVESGATVAHVWDDRGGAGGSYTYHATGTWAFCTPLRSASSPGWCLYIAGESDQPHTVPHDAADLHDDVKFAELVADTVSRLRDLRRLERRQSVLSQFISPIVLGRIAEGDPDQLLAPRESEVSVMFCDLRGFSRVSEQSARDLFGLLGRVSQALGVMTSRILATGGVVGDFHGDAAMGFWGWPLDQADRVERACRAALAISTDFASAASVANHLLADFRIGIGMAAGRAVAGRIGTADHMKITVFGPVVNLAARLQDLTKQLRAAILIDESMAEVIRAHVSRDVARVRRVARIRPRGLETAVEVHQLLPPESLDPLMKDEHVAAYEAAWDAVVAGDWEQAFALLHHVPAEDRVKDFLTILIAQHHRTPPANWDGVIDLSRSG